MMLWFRMSRWQLFVLVYLTSFCMTPFGFATLHWEAGRHIWLPALAQGLVTMTSAAGVVLLLHRLPGLSLLSIAEQALGRIPAQVYVALVGLFLWFWGPIGNQTPIRLMVQSTMLPSTAPVLIAMTTLLVAAYAAYFGAEVVARVGEIAAFLLIPLIPILALVPYANSDLGRLLPLTGVPVEITRTGVFWAYALGLRGFFLPLAFAGMFHKDVRLHLPVLGGAAAASLVVTLLVILPHTIFVPDAVRRFQFPVLESMDTVRAAAVGVQSFVAVTETVWFVIGWVVVAATLCAAAHAMAMALGAPSHRWLLMPLALAALAVTSYPVSPDFRTRMLVIWSAMGYVLGLAGPWLILLVTALRGADQGAVRR